MKKISKLAVLGVSLSLAGCSVLNEDKIQYQSASKGQSLEVPPDLTQLSRDSRYATPTGPVTASGYQANLPASASIPAATTAATTLADIRIERSGNQRWLVVARPADKLWGSIRDFWQENGFVLSMDQSKLGIMETDWAENRAKLPQDFIRRSIGKVFDSLYSTGERDKFRTRLEQNTAGSTEIFITHRGMIEVYSNTAKDSTVWQPRPTDPELEVEFLRRLMEKLGASTQQAKTLLPDNPQPVKGRAEAITLNGQPLVQLTDGFDSAWRRVGLSLDRTGFTVEDRDRTRGIYFVRYIDPSVDKSEPGFFARMFGSATPDAKPLKLQIAVRSQANTSVVSVLDANGAPDSSAHAQTIVKLLTADLQ